MTQIIMVTKNGLISKFDTKDVPLIKRGSVGFRGMMVRQNDEIVGIAILEEEQIINKLEEKDNDE